MMEYIYFISLPLSYHVRVHMSCLGDREPPVLCSEFNQLQPGEDRLEYFWHTPQSQKENHEEALCWRDGHFIWLMSLLANTITSWNGIKSSISRGWYWWQSRRDSQC